DRRGGRGVAVVPERRRRPDRRGEPRPHRRPHRDRGRNGNDGRTHLERLGGRAAPPAGVRRHRGHPEIPGDVMGHDPWTELRDRAERVRRTIEAELRVTTPGVLQEAPAEHGLFALAAHTWAPELKTSPPPIAAPAPPLT